jgi:ADP-dependent NAD(P)H-hydrate dehydratase / NAD(P)H-hydrate epimerase
MDKRIPAITQKQVAAFLGARPRDSHKGMFGAVTVIGGDSGMLGAPLIAARAALKLGAGCVHVGLLAQDAPAVDMAQPELMLHGASELLSTLASPRPNLDRTASYSTKPASRQVAGYLPQAGEGATVKSVFNPVLAVGCGMGTSVAAQKLLTDAIRLSVPLVLDADALNLLARHADLQEDVRVRSAATVITPHPGEAARLLGTRTAEVQAARAESARRLAQLLHCSVVLKGADSICVTRDGKAWLNRTGNPGMSSAGMGDALTGMIAAFIAQGLDADRALLLAVHLHGAGGDALAEQQAAVGMTATEVTEWARWLLNRWMAQR